MQTSNVLKSCIFVDTFWVSAVGLSKHFCGLDVVDLRMGTAKSVAAPCWMQLRNRSQPQRVAWHERIFVGSQWGLRLCLGSFKGVYHSKWPKLPKA